MRTGTVELTQELIQDSMPPPHTNVVVKVHGFNCLAYVDFKGNWRFSFGRELIGELVEGWLPMASVRVDYVQGNYFTSEMFDAE